MYFLLLVYLPSVRAEWEGEEFYLRRGLLRVRSLYRFACLRLRLHCGSLPRVLFPHSLIARSDGRSCSVLIGLFIARLTIRLRLCP